MSNSEVRLEVLNPAGNTQKAKKKTLASRPASLDGKRLGLVYNLKTGGDTLLTRASELLQEKYNIADVNWFKRACCVEPPEGYIDSAAEGSDVVVAAAAD
jgi:hypothetical protein